MNESGGHRWQRIPPTERKGRIHTSTVTIAVFEMNESNYSILKDSDITIFTTKDSGPGGQHRNKTESCVVMRHEPTKIEAKAASKSQFQNRKTARELLEHRVMMFKNNQSSITQNQNRKELVGSGMRGDKIRTYREQDNIVIDHISGKKLSLKDINKGKLDLLY